MDWLDILIEHRDKIAELGKTVSDAMEGIKKPKPRIYAPIERGSKPRIYAPIVGTPKIDIVIPHRGGFFVKGRPTVGLYLTLLSCEHLLKNSGYDWKYFIVSNGNSKSAGDERDSRELAFDYARNTGHLEKIFDVEEGLMPFAARNLGANAGTAELLVFLDDHVNVHEGFFSGIIETFNTTNAASVRGITFVFYTSVGRDIPRFFVIFDLDHPFWGFIRTSQFGLPSKPYRIVSSGHGAFAVRRSVWQDVGGYWDGLVGFSCEEMEFDLRLALMDHEIVFNPKVSHWHNMDEPKGYSRALKAENIETMCAVANIIGGPEYASRVIRNVRLSTFVPGMREWVEEWVEECLAAAIQKSDSYARHFASKRKRSLEEQIAKFKREGVMSIR